MANSYQLLDPLRPQEYEALRIDIAKRGVMVAIEELDAMVAELDATIPFRDQLHLVESMLTPEAFSLFLTDMLRKPSLPRKAHCREEFILRDHLAQKLRDDGFQVSIEVGMPVCGRCDIVIWGNGLPTHLIEVKVVNPIQGVGQLLAYGSQWKHKPRLILATTLADRLCELACEAVGIELWIL